MAIWAVDAGGVAKSYGILVTLYPVLQGSHQSVYLHEVEVLNKSLTE